MVFWLILSAIVLAQSAHNLFVKRKCKKRSFRFWDKDYHNQHLVTISDIKHYYENHHNDNCSLDVDETTWSDLELDRLFNRINYCHTSIGEEYLYNNIKKRESVIDEALIEKLETDKCSRQRLTQMFQRTGYLEGSDTSAFFSRRLAPHIKKRYLYCATLPIICFLLLIISMKVWLLTTIAVSLFNVFYFYRTKLTLEYELNRVFYLARLLKGSALYIKWKKSANLTLSYKRLLSFRLLAFFFNRNSLDGGINLFNVFRGVFLFDLILYNFMLGSIAKKQSDVAIIWHALAKLDINISVCKYRETLSFYAIPVFSDVDRFLFKEMVHPLTEEGVPNSLTWNDNIILTGTNSAGKSTFIKALALNVILAQAINTVVAEKAVLNKIVVQTSMAIKDDLLTGESFFVAETKSIRRLLTLVAKKQPTIVIMDEILKGTNANERISASLALMKWFNQFDELKVCIATHDLMLAEVGMRGFVNYHFSNKVVGEQIEFDYKLQKGISKTRNAIGILAAYDFPAEVVMEAKRISKLIDSVGGIDNVVYRRTYIK